MAYALVTPSVLRWARDRVSLSVGEVADYIRPKNSPKEKWIEKIKKWEKEGGEKLYPSFTDLEKLSKIYAVPEVVFYLDLPPKEEEPDLPDFRTIGDNRLSISSSSVALRQLIHNTLSQQDFVKEVIQQERLNFRPLFDVQIFDVQKKSPPETLATLMKKELKLPNPSSNYIDSYDKHRAFRNSLIQGVRDLGVFVVRLKRIVGNKRELHDFKVEEFRGFALCDDIAPFIFINDNDTPVAQHFTIMHELTHLWINKSGISNANHLKKVASNNNVEKYCNAVAAEFLVPKKELKKRCEQYDWTIDSLARYFSVSRIVIARRLLDIELWTQFKYWRYYKSLETEWEKKETEKTEKNFRISPYISKQSQYGKNLLSILSHAISNGQLTPTEGAGMIQTNPISFMKCMEEVNRVSNI